jgi:hypothetical protein
MHEKFIPLRHLTRAKLEAILRLGERTSEIKVNDFYFLERVDDTKYAIYIMCQDPYIGIHNIRVSKFNTEKDLVVREYNRNQNETLSTPSNSKHPYDKLSNIILSLPDEYWYSYTYKYTP